MSTWTNRQLLQIAEEMEEIGGNFAKCLGLAMRAADDQNRRRIADAFPEMMSQYWGWIVSTKEKKENE